MAAMRRSSSASTAASMRAPASPFSRTRSAAACPARRPKVTVSMSELPPRRFAPCTDTQAASPAAHRPGTTVSPQTSTSTPPIW